MLELNQILSIIDAIPEYMCTRSEAEFLYTLSSKTTGMGSIVEIGTKAGMSTIALAYGQQIKNGAKINTIDILEYPPIIDNLAKAGVIEYVNRIICRSSIVASKWSEPIELLWIDGDHRSNGVMADIQAWSRFVISGGILAFHDYPAADKGFNEVWEAIYKCVFSQPEKWRVISDREVGSIIVFQKSDARDAIRLPLKTKIEKTLYWKQRNIEWYFEEISARFKTKFIIT